MRDSAKGTVESLHMDLWQLTKGAETLGARMYLNKASKQQEKRKQNKKKTSCNWKHQADGHQPKQQLTKDNQIPSSSSLLMCPFLPPLFPFPKDTTPSGVKGEPGWEGALSISIAIETTQGMTLLCDSVDTECCYQDIQRNKPKCHTYTQEKKIY